MSSNLPPDNTPTEKIVPFFFGDQSQLYGCYHDPVATLSSTLVICQPIGHEYERCHRAMRQLAVQAARKGAGVMRFDYYATGDSAGDSSELTLPRMQQDIQQAVDECLVKSGRKELTLVGLRLGATLAARVALNSTSVDLLVMYAPVFDGKRLFEEWQAEQAAFAAKHSHQADQADEGEILGFPVSGEFVQALDTGLVPEPGSTSLKRVLVLLDEADKHQEALNRWLGVFETQHIPVDVITEENIAIWRREPMDAIVPIKTIRRITKWVNGQ